MLNRSFVLITQDAHMFGCILVTANNQVESIDAIPVWFLCLVSDVKLIHVSECFHNFASAFHVGFDSDSIQFGCWI